MWAWLNISYLFSEFSQVNTAKYQHHPDINLAEFIGTEIF